MERQAAEVIRIVTGSNIKYPEGKETVDMCLALQQIREEGEIMGAIRTYKKMGVSQEEAQGYLMDEYKKNAEKIQELIKMYWK